MMAWTDRPLLRERTSQDEGSAAIELLFGSIVLLVPVVYLILLLGTVQAQSFAVESASRHAARSIARGGDAGAGRAERIIDAIEADYGIARRSLTVEVSCAPSGSRCPRAGTTVTVRVRADVPLPFLSGLGEITRRTSVPVTGESSYRVSRFSREP